MAENLPLNTDSMVHGLGYFTPAGPSTDAAPSASGSSQIPDLPQGEPSPMQSVSMATDSVPLPSMGARQMTDIHKDRWLDYDKPHVASSEED